VSRAILPIWLFLKAELLVGRINQVADLTGCVYIQVPSFLSANTSYLSILFDVLWIRVHSQMTGVLG
jgi:hypothetical protein